jgi:hypothetical protein
MPGSIITANYRRICVAGEPAKVALPVYMRKVVATLDA